MSTRRVRIQRWTRRFLSASGLLAIAMSIVCMASTALSEGGGNSGVPLVYADDPPTTTKPKTTSTNGSSKNGASNDNRNDNDQQRVLRPVNLAVGEIEYSDRLIVNEKVDICVNYTVFGDRDERFTISFFIEGHDLQEEQVRFRDGEHRECFEARLHQAGPQFVRFRLDAENNIAESNEDDNNVSKTLTWVEEPRPDLSPAFLGNRARLTNSCDEPLRFFTGVENKGSVFPGSFDVELFVDGERKKRDRVQDVRPTSTTFVDFDVKVSAAGWHEVRFKVDTDDEVDESD